MDNVVLRLTGDNTFFWCLLFIVAVFLTCILVKKTRNDITLKKGDVFFKVFCTGIEYTAINEVSGGIKHHCLLWSDIVTSPQRNCSSDMHFLKDGYKNNTKNIVIYISRHLGVVEEVLISVHHIKIFRISWRMLFSIFINVALLLLPILTIDEEV